MTTVLICIFIYKPIFGKLPLYVSTFLVVVFNLPKVVTEMWKTIFLLWTHGIFGKTSRSALFCTHASFLWTFYLLSLFLQRIRVQTKQILNKMKKCNRYAQTGFNQNLHVANGTADLFQFWPLWWVRRFISLFPSSYETFVFPSSWLKHTSLTPRYLSNTEHDFIQP